MTRWMHYAEEELGQSERPGKDHNPRILEYGKPLGLTWFKADEIAWCGIFVGWCLERAGIHSTRSAMARSYEKYGTRLKEPVPGCIAVLNRPGGLGWQGHVGFFLELKSDRVLLLGGNQGDKVSKAWFNASRVITYRWPPGAPVEIAPVGTTATTIDTKTEVSDR